MNAVIANFITRQHGSGPGFKAVMLPFLDHTSHFFPRFYALGPWLHTYKLQSPAAVQMVLFFIFLSNISEYVSVSLQVCFGRTLISNLALSPDLVRRILIPVIPTGVWKSTDQRVSPTHCSPRPALPLSPTPHFWSTEMFILFSSPTMAFKFFSLHILPTTAQMVGEEDALKQKLTLS